MGRKRKYHTDEERRAANRLKQRRYYQRHRKEIIAHKMKMYWEKKNEQSRVDKKMS